MNSIKNSANFKLCFIFFYEHYAWFTYALLYSAQGGLSHHLSLGMLTSQGRLSASHGLAE